MILETKINVQRLKDIVTAVDHLQEAGLVENAKQTLQILAKEIMESAQ